MVRLVTREKEKYIDPDSKDEEMKPEWCFKEDEIDEAHCIKMIQIDKQRGCRFDQMREVRSKVTGLICLVRPSYKPKERGRLHLSGELQGAYCHSSR